MQSEEWNKVANKVNFTLDLDLNQFQKLVHPTSKILDFGCGYGRHTDTLVQNGYSNVFGIDSSEEMITRGQKEFPHLTLLHNNLDSIPCEDESLDCVLACAVFTCIPSEVDRKKIFEELCRVLRRDGVLHLIEFGLDYFNSYDDNGCFLSSLNVQMKHFSRKEIEALCSPLETINMETTKASAIGNRLTEAHSYFGRKT